MCVVGVFPDASLDDDVAGDHTVGGSSTRLRVVGRAARRVRSRRCGRPGIIHATRGCLHGRRRSAVTPIRALALRNVVRPVVIAFDQRPVLGVELGHAFVGGEPVHPLQHRKHIRLDQHVGAAVGVLIDEVVRIVDVDGIEVVQMAGEGQIDHRIPPPSGGPVGHAVVLHRHVEVLVGLRLGKAGVGVLAVVAAVLVLGVSERDDQCEPVDVGSDVRFVLPGPHPVVHGRRAEGEPHHDERSLGGVDGGLHLL